MPNENIQCLLCDYIIFISSIFLSFIQLVNTILDYHLFKMFSLGLLVRFRCVTTLFKSELEQKAPETDLWIEIPTSKSCLKICDFPYYGLTSKHDEKTGKLIPLTVEQVATILDSPPFAKDFRYYENSLPRLSKDAGNSDTLILARSGLILQTPVRVSISETLLAAHLCMVIIILSLLLQNAALVFLNAITAGISGIKVMPTSVLSRVNHG